MLVFALLGLAISACAVGTKRPGAAGPAGSGARSFVYVGTGAGIIEIFALDETSGSLASQNKVNTGGVLAALGGLAFGQTLIAVDERSTAVLTFAVDAKAGTLRPVGRASTGGSRPGRVTIDGTGKFILISNRGNASVGVVALKSTGQLGGPELFAAGTGAYGLSLHPSNTLLFVANSKAGTVSQMAFNAGTGGLTAKPGGPAGLPAGSGPRQVSCHPGGRWVYVLNETNSTVSVHTFDDLMGTITPLAFQIVSTLDTPAGVAPRKSAHATDMVVASAGHFVYVLNRGDDSLVTFAVDREPGGLSFANRTPSGGGGAANLALDPGGAFLFVTSAGSRQISTFRLDPDSGTPTLTDNTRVGGAPTALTVLRPLPQ